MWTLETQTDGVLEVRYSLAGLASRTTYEVHVHEFGAVGVPDGSGVGRVYEGPCEASCRPAGQPQAVGAIGAGGVGQVWTGQAAPGAEVFAAFRDGVAALEGERDILGRSLVLHSPSGAAVQQCVIGRAHTDEPREMPPYDGTELPPHVWAAQCAMRVPGADSESLAGVVTIDTRSDGSGLRFEVHGKGVLRAAEGEAPGARTYSLLVHAKGDLEATLGGKNPVFKGIDSGCNRAVSDCDREVGLLGGEGGMLTSDDRGHLHDILMDDRAALAGPNSIVGRAISLYDTESEEVVAACVVGAVTATLFRPAAFDGSDGGAAVPADDDGLHNDSDHPFGLEAVPMGLVMMAFGVVLGAVVAAPVACLVARRRGGFGASARKLSKFSSFSGLESGTAVEMAAGSGASVEQNDAAAEDQA